MTRIDQQLSMTMFISHFITLYHLITVGRHFWPWKLQNCIERWVFVATRWKEIICCFRLVSRPIIPDSASLLHWELAVIVFFFLVFLVFSSVSIVNRKQMLSVGQKTSLRSVVRPQDVLFCRRQNKWTAKFDKTARLTRFLSCFSAVFPSVSCPLRRNGYVRIYVQIRCEFAVILWFLGGSLLNWLIFPLFLVI